MNNSIAYTAKPLELQNSEALREHTNFESMFYGVSHKNYRAIADHKQGADYFVKLFTGKHAKILYNNELEVLKATKNDRFTPTLIEYCNKELFIVQSFINGSTLTDSPLSTFNKIKIAGQLTANCHQTIDKQSVNVAELDFNLLVRELLTNVEIPFDKKQVVIEKVKAITDSLDDIDKVVCHGDVNFSNILMSQIPHDNANVELAYLIDWECVSVASRYFDLGMCASINQLGLSNIALLVEQYLTSLNDNTGICLQNAMAKVTRYCDISNVINGLWFLADKQSQLSHGQKECRTLIQSANNQSEHFIKLLNKYL